MAIRYADPGPAPKKIGMGPIRITPQTLPEPENTDAKTTMAIPRNTKDRPIIIKPSILRETKKLLSLSSMP